MLSSQLEKLSNQLQNSLGMSARYLSDDEKEKLLLLRQKLAKSANGRIINDWPHGVAVKYHSMLRNSALNTEWAIKRFDQELSLHSKIELFVHCRKLTRQLQAYRRITRCRLGDSLKAVASAANKLLESKKDLQAEDFADLSYLRNRIVNIASCEFIQNETIENNEEYQQLIDGCESLINGIEASIKDKSRTREILGKVEEFYLETHRFTQLMTVA